MVQQYGFVTLANNLKNEPLAGVINGLLHQLSLAFKVLAEQGSPEFTGLMKSNYFAYVGGFASFIGDTSGFATVGGSIYYTPYMEFGTKPHWPPRAALQPWADAHDVPVFVVQRAIARRGNIGNHMFLKAFERFLSGEMDPLFAEAAKMIELSVTKGTI